VWNYCNRCDLPRWLAVIAYDQDLHVHHRHYQNVGDERPEDLESLCKRCHEIETFGRSRLRSVRAEKCPGCHGPNFDPYADFCSRCCAVAEYANSLSTRSCGVAAQQPEEREGILRGEEGGSQDVHIEESVTKEP
jgi:hypothetical protein